MNTLVKHINKMVGMFLQNNADAANQEELWMSPENQKQVKSVLTRANNKAVVKDPNAPKRAKSAYLFFCDDNRDKVKKQLGKDAKATDVTKQLGAEWNKLKAKNGTAPYNKMAAKDQERYLKEKKEMSGKEVVDEKVETKTEVVVETEVVETKKKKAPKKGSKK